MCKRNSIINCKNTKFYKKFIDDDDQQIDIEHKNKISFNEMKHIKKLLHYQRKISQKEWFRYHGKKEKIENLVFRIHGKPPEQKKVKKYHRRKKNVLRDSIQFLRWNKGVFFKLKNEEKNYIHCSICCFFFASIHNLMAVIVMLSMS